MSSTTIRNERSALETLRGQTAGKLAPNNVLLRLGPRPAQTTHQILLNPARRRSAPNGAATLIQAMDLFLKSVLRLIRPALLSANPRTTNKESTLVGQFGTGSGEQMKTPRVLKPVNAPAKFIVKSRPVLQVAGGGTDISYPNRRASKPRRPNGWARRLVLPKVATIHAFTAARCSSPSPGSP